MSTESRKASASASPSAKTLKSLAEDIYESLRKDGCQPRDIVTLSTRLIELVTDQMSVGTATREQ